MITFLKFLLVSILFSFSIFAQEGFERFKLELTSYHAPDWNKVSQIFNNDSEKLRESLLKIYSDTELYYPPTDNLPEAIQLARKNALMGLGQFTPISNSEASKEVESFLLQELSGNQSDRLSIIYGLANLGSESSLNSLVDILNASNDETELLPILDAIDHHINGPVKYEKVGDLKYVKDFENKNIETPLSKRGGGDWSDALLKVDLATEKLRDRVKDNKYAISLSSIDLVRKKILDSAKSQGFVVRTGEVGTRKNRSLNNKSSNRQIASDSSSTQNNSMDNLNSSERKSRQPADDGSSNNKLYYLFALIGVLLVLFFVLKKK